MRAAWKAKLAAEQLYAGRLVFLRTRWAPILRWRPSTGGREAGSGLATRCPETAVNRAVRARRALGEHDALEGMGDLAWRWRGAPPLPSSKPTTSSGCSGVHLAGGTGGRGDGQSLCAHKTEKVRELVEARGCELACTCRLTHRTYNPIYNPIEEAFAKIKGLLCGRPKPGAAGLWSRLWAWRSRRSRPRTPAASSGTAGTTGRFNRCDERCRP